MSKNISITTVRISEPLKIAFDMYAVSNNITLSRFLESAIIGTVPEQFIELAERSINES